AILFDEGEIRATGRSAAGVRGMKLRPDDQIVGMDVLTRADMEKNSMAVVFENGFGKRTLLKHFDTQHRGGMGIKAADVTPKVGRVVFAEVVSEDAHELMLISKNGT